MIAITARGLSVRYGEAIALDRVDLVVEAGELYLLLGPSGSGKTTLLRSIAGFVSPSEGSVHLGERDVTHLAPHLRGTAMVFQSFALFPHLDVRENVAFGLRQRKVDRDSIETRVLEALKSVRMASYVDRRIDELSGGEQQRVALARALVVRPSCLLLDEPLSNLDAHLRESMREEIRRICKERGLTALYVTHDQKEALAIADKIAVMRGGRILQVGKPFDVYRRPVSRAVAAFLGETNLLEGTTESNGSSVRVSTKVGELVATGPSPGVKVWVSLRPESLSLVRANAERGALLSSPSTVLSGVIEGTTYLGPIAEHRVRVRGEILRVEELNPRFEVGDGAAVELRVSPDDVVLLPFDDGDRDA